MKHELLAPAGDIESLYQAIHNGADAVYLGLKTFGARAYSKNFDNDEIIKAIETAHLYGVKIYVTMNTLVKDSEVEDFLEQVEFLYLNGRTLEEGKDYALDYGDNLIGKGNLTVVGIGDFTGEKKATFKIYPEKVTGQKVLSSETTSIKIR